MAFAAVISLKHTIERLPILTNPASTELNSLRYMLERLDDESSRRIDRSAINEVDAKIRDAVWKLEDFLESSSRPLSLEINSFLKTAKELGEEYESLLQTPLPAEEDIIDDAAAAAVSPIHNNSTTIVLSDLYTQIRTQLLERVVDKKGLEQEIDLFLMMANELKEHIINGAAVSRKYNYSTMVGFSDLCKEIRTQLLERVVDEKGLEQVIDLFLKMAMKAIQDIKEIHNNSTTVRLSDLSKQIRAQLLKGVVDEKGLEQEIDLFLKMAMKLKEHIIDDAAALSRIHNYSTTVGLSHLSKEIIFDQLLEGTTERKIVSLVGMAGIGKTHLTRDICSHPHILHHFELRALVRVGPKYKDPMNVLVDILTQIEREPRDVLKNQSLNTLEYLLRNSLRGRRYLIVLDDVWTTTALNDCIRCIPANNNGSRFLLTTRLLEVADQFQKYEMPFLNLEESWNLLWRNVFVGESNFPSQLEEAGRKIAEICEGLPLLILAVAHILRWRKQTEEYWNKVAEKENSTFRDACDRISEVLLPSYEYLPQHLKPCFLYMGVFPQSREIVLSKLTDFWIVEDILQLSLSQNLEVFAMECMQDLVSHSLAIVCKRRFNRIKSSKLHTAYWHLCIVEARKSEFFHVFNKLTDVFIKRSRRLAIQNNMLFGIKEVYNSMGATTSATRSLLCTGEDHQYQVPICFDVMILIKVLDALAIRFYEFPIDVVDLLQLRYLSLTHNGEVPSSISNLQQLEWLNLRQHHYIKMVQRDSTTYLPQKIWVMKTLKHLRIMGSMLPDPSKGSELPNLSTLYVNADSCTEDVFKSIPNLKKLGINIELHPEGGAETVRCLEHIGVLTKLKSLKCVVVNPRLSRLAFAPQEHLSNLPKSLEMLSLNGLGYSWEYMNAIASLPFLKKLKLQCSAFQGPEWETKAVGQFQRLEFLLLEDMDLVHWIVEQEDEEEEEEEEEDEEEEEEKEEEEEEEEEEEDEEEEEEKKEAEAEAKAEAEAEEEDSFNKSFRSLRHLIVRHCYKMKKIPWKVLSLERMELDECIPSLMGSLQRIRYKAQQLSYERKYSHLQAVINSSWNL